MADAKIPIALQLYSVRHQAQNDLFGVLRKVAEMGYDGVEFAGYYGNDPREIRKVLDDVGLKAEGTHTGLADLAEDAIERTVELHQVLGAPYCVVPSLPKEARNTPDACRTTAETLSSLTEFLGSQGLRAGFHAHRDDMLPLSGGPSAWQLLAENTPPEFIMQYDTANGLSGGADPVQPILDFPGRSVSLHLKEGDDLEFGEGPVPWNRVFEAAESVGGTQWYVVEYEVEGRDALEGVARAIEYLRQAGR